MLNAAARIVSGIASSTALWRSSCIVHTELHWFRVPERVMYKLGVMIYVCCLYTVKRLETSSTILLADLWRPNKTASSYSSRRLYFLPYRVIDSAQLLWTSDEIVWLPFHHDTANVTWAKCYAPSLNTTCTGHKNVPLCFRLQLQRLCNYKPIE